MKKLTKLETAVVVVSLNEQQTKLIKKLMRSKDKTEKELLKNIIKQIESALEKIGGDL